MHAVAAGSKRKSCALASASATARPPAIAMMGAPASDAEDDEEAAASPTPSGSQRLPKVRVGNRNLTMHVELVEMTDSTDEFRRGDFATLRQRLDQDGFLFIRGVMQRSTVAAAREKMLRHLASKGAIRSGTDPSDAFIEYQAVWEEKNGGGKGKRAAKVQPAAPSMGMMSMASASSSRCSSAGGAGRKMIPGWTVDAESGGIIGGREPDSAIKGWHAIGNSRELTDVYNGAELKDFYTRLFAQSPAYASRPHMAKLNLPPFSALPSCTWLRAKGPGEVTAEHADYYYFYKNTHIFRDYWRVETDEREQRAKEEPEQTAEERETCQVCHDPRDPDSTLICDLCDRGFHVSCLQPRLTTLPDEEQEWHCYECQNRPMEYWTCWTPLADISGHDGRLALIAGSHRALSGYEAPVREDLLPRDFTKAFEAKAVWQTPTTIGMGDVILFNIKTIHAATKNAGEKFRLSLDTRVTTCFGKEYCRANGIESIEQVDQQFAHARDAAANLKGEDVDMLAAKVSAKIAPIIRRSKKDEAAGITAFFPAAKRQKLAPQMTMG